MAESDHAAPDVFRTTFACENCGHTWDETYPARTAVETLRSDRVLAYNTDCDELGTDCECCTTLQCPVCDLSRAVTVSDRNPRETDDAN